MSTWETEIHVNARMLVIVPVITRPRLVGLWVYKSGPMISVVLSRWISVSDINSAPRSQTYQCHDKQISRGSIFGTGLEGHCIEDVPGNLVGLLRGALPSVKKEQDSDGPEPLDSIFGGVDADRKAGNDKSLFRDRHGRVTSPSRCDQDMVVIIVSWASKIHAQG